MEKPLWFPLDRIVRLRAFQALGHREYRLLWYSQVFASLGVWMDQVTRGWLIYELTDSALQLGLVRGIQAIPFLFLSPSPAASPTATPKVSGRRGAVRQWFYFHGHRGADSLRSHSAVACLSDCCSHGLRAGVSSARPRRHDLRYRAAG